MDAAKVRDIVALMDRTAAVPFNPDWPVVRSILTNPGPWGFTEQEARDHFGESLRGLPVHQVQARLLEATEARP